MTNIYYECIQATVTNKHGSQMQIGHDGGTGLTLLRLIQSRTEKISCIECLDVGGIKSLTE